MEFPNEIKVVLDDGAKLPELAHNTDAGFDLFCREDSVILPRSSGKFDTGVHIQIPQGYVGFLKSKSGLNVKNDITGTGVIDSGYTGPIVVKLYNNGDEPKRFSAGDKIIQIVLLRCYTPDLVQVKSLEETDRGDNGFGSTGR